MEKTRIPKYAIGHKWRLTEHLAITYHSMLHYGRGFHREDGPAVVQCERGDEFWYYKNRLHRLDGPAIVYADGREYYFLDGRYYSFEGFLKAVKIRGVIHGTH